MAVPMSEACIFAYGGLFGRLLMLTKSVFLIENEMKLFCCGAMMILAHENRCVRSLS